MKKLIAVLMVVAMMLSAAVPVFAEGETAPETTVTANRIYAIPAGETTYTLDSTEYQVIHTVADLQNMATANKTNFILANDIDCSAADTSKGYVVDLPSTVVLEGNNCALTGIHISSSGKDVSVFNGNGTDKTSITIRNLTLGRKDAHLTISSNGGTVGTLFANITAELTLDNIRAYADITTEGTYAVGGIIGHLGTWNTAVNHKFKIENVTFSGSINAKMSNDDGIGGLIGTLENILSDWNATTGEGENKTYVNACSIKNCVNNASVSNMDHEGVGGLIGLIKSEIVLEISNCTNNGTVKGPWRTGGLIGSASHNSRSWDYILKMTDCLNMGNVQGNSCVGGIVGAFGPANRDKTFIGCVNKGTVTGTGRTVGGMVGELTFGTAGDATIIDFSKCINYGAVSADGANVAGMLGAVGSTGNTAKQVNFQQCINFGTVSAKAENATGMIASCTSPGPTTFTNCLNAGTVSAVTSIERTNGMLGWTNGGQITLTGCVNTGEIAGSAKIMLNLTETKSIVAMTDCQGYAKGLTDTTSKDENPLATAVQYLNGNENFKSITGGFIMNESGTKIVSAMPSFAGVQNNVADNGKQNIRLVATINDSLAYRQVGFRVSIICNGQTMPEQTLGCAYVYNTVTGSVNGVTESYTAASLGGTYIYALTLQNVPVGENVVIHITPFAIANDDNDGTIFEQDSFTAIYHNSEFQELKKN